MFNIKLIRDWFNDNLDKRNKITGIMITCGYYCNNSCYCDCRSQCKYGKDFQFNNRCVRVRNFFQYKLHIKLPHLISIHKHYVDLSGTPKCPFKKEREYSCHHCKYHAGFDEYMKGLCGNEEYRRLNREGRAMEHYLPGKRHCKFFEKNEWADKWDKNTGEIIYD